MLVVHFLGSMRPGHDGVTQVAYRLREGFNQEKGNHFFVAPILPKTFEEDMKKVKSVPFPLSTDYRLSVSRTQTLSALLKLKKPDAIHIHTPCTLGYRATQAARALGIPVVATYHTHFPSYLKYYRMKFLEPWVWQYLRSLFNSAQKVIVPSRTTLTELQQNGFKNLVHIPHGVDTRCFSPERRSTNWRNSVGGENKIIVLFVGRLVWEKNLRLIAKMLPFLKQRNKIQLVFVGEGPAHEELSQLIPEAYFTGFLGPELLSTAYASSDLFIFPSVTETFGNVTIEAMASGLPPICASSGGACDVIHSGVNGILTRPNDPEDFSKAIDSLIENADQRKKLSGEALQSASLYQWPKTISEYEDLYQNLVRSSPFVSSNLDVLEMDPLLGPIC